VRDATGADATAWARWIRGWSAEENRHSDVLNRYMYLSGRFDMREVERTVQRLIRDRMTVHAPSSLPRVGARLLHPDCGTRPPPPPPPPPPAGAPHPGKAPPPPPPPQIARMTGDPPGGGLTSRW
jgi:hypothetical protein